MGGSGETDQESGGRRVTSRGRGDRRGKREEVNEKREGQWEVVTERG